ncbi:transporter substrate-binding domain-containing protein [Desulfovibrio litoralis]|uniref:Arginine/ornithine transport system substrate-binding protein n=1 Tax=Desulfovibrio litoralis DSM 11393 TaxID=1121455 RepID=A0A1M7SKS3_9BACT|nr:transporter substrate-binding domain-containing protein [Desulfovibrio litoralis]SHN59083.1 arginine/ornithine transport system substrate-binding protein [Desulfovibrio litoralis DSM 11393]
MRSFLLALIFTMIFTSLSLAQQPVLRIGIDAPYPPFAYNDPKTGKLTGFDFDMAEALCKELNRKCEISVVPFDDIIPNIVAGKLDIGVAGMAKKPEREALVLFSDKYFRSSSMFISLSSIKEITPEVLKGKKIGVQSQTTQEDFLKKSYGDIATIVPMKSFDDIIQAAINKDIDLAFIDGLPGYEFLRTPKGEQFDIAGEPIKLGDGSCVVLDKKLTQERDAINKAILKLRNSGEYQQINRKYFEFDIY